MGETEIVSPTARWIRATERQCQRSLVASFFSIEGGEHAKFRIKTRDIQNQTSGASFRRERKLVGPILLEASINEERRDDLKDRALPLGLFTCGDSGHRFLANGIDEPRLRLARLLPRRRRDGRGRWLWRLVSLRFVHFSKGGFPLLLRGVANVDITCARTLSTALVNAFTSISSFRFQESR